MEVFCSVAPFNGSAFRWLKEKAVGRSVLLANVIALVLGLPEDRVLREPIMPSLRGSLNNELQA